jgi:hypothetical protein
MLSYLTGSGLTIQAQNTTPATGGNATGEGGTVSYFVGQVTYNIISGTNETLAQGVQQPYEISVVTAIENTENITLECIVYPNPTEGIIKLFIKSYENYDMRFKLYDINGVLLQDKKIEDKETEISLINFSSTIYFLKVIKDNKEIKIFKIIKR